MELEIEAPDHSTIIVPDSDSNTEIGRASSAGDRTVSRRHVLLKPSSAATENGTPEPRACFEVAGKNPVWVRRGTQAGKKIEIFRRSERGELGCGDAICLSGRSPAWFLVKKRSGNDDKENKSDIDLESIDPVKEFGFVVAGREFDQYPKHRIRDFNSWKWFLEESGDESSEDGSRSRKRRKSAEKEGSGDEDWTGESEEDREVMKRAKRTGGKAAYTTRSRDNKRSGSSKPSSAGKMSGEDESEDEDDETLGGFIVEDGDDVAELEEEDDDEEEDEEFDDEEEDE